MSFNVILMYSDFIYVPLLSKLPENGFLFHLHIYALKVLSDKKHSVHI